MQQLAESQISEQRKGLNSALESTSELAISLENVCFSFDGREAVLNKISLRVHRGELVSVLGPSGSGKTSLLRCIAGNLKVKEGQVSSLGEIARIYQDLRLVQQASALRNVLHGSIRRLPRCRSLLGFPKNEHERAESLLKQVGVWHRAHVPVSKLSGGERQRVAIARALMQEPAILLADEPVASLDHFNAHAIMGLLSRVCRERNITLITVLHDQNLARLYSDRVVVLEDSALVSDIGTSSMRAEAAPCPKGFETCRENNRALLDTEKQLKPKGSPKAFAAVLISLLAFAWALSELDFRFGIFKDASSGMRLFLSGLLPHSAEEFFRIPWSLLFGSLVETLQMSIVGTIFGVFIAWPLAALAAKNVGIPGISSSVRFLLNTVRTIPSLIWALLFVSMVGLGVWAGVLALICYSVGYLSKFFYEAFEAADPGPQQALKELGAHGVERFLHAVWPAARIAVLSSSFFMLEYNVRAASVLGVVDAGGIGFYLKQYIDYRFFPAVSAGLLMILGVVLVLDLLSTKARARMLRRYEVE